MTELEKWFAAYFAPEYLNVQDPKAFKALAWDALQKLIAAGKVK